MMISSSTYAHLREVVDFIGAPHLLEVLEGASRGLSPRLSVSRDVDDESVIEAVCRLLADGIADDLRLLREDLLNAVPRITDRGRLLHEAIGHLVPPMELHNQT